MELRDDAAEMTFWGTKLVVNPRVEAVHTANKRPKKDFIFLLLFDESARQSLINKQREIPTNNGVSCRFFALVVEHQINVEILGTNRLSDVHLFACLTDDLELSLQFAVVFGFARVRVYPFASKES